MRRLPDLRELRRDLPEECDTGFDDARELCSDCLGGEPVEPAAPQGGRCGSDVSWSFEDGVLTISGTGRMDDFGKTDPPWSDILDDIRSIEVTDGVTSIGSGAFAGSNVKNVQLADTVTEIGPSAFSDCSGLRSITIPAGVTTLGGNAFGGTGTKGSPLRITFLGSEPKLYSTTFSGAHITLFYPERDASWTAVKTEAFENASLRWIAKDILVPEPVEAVTVTISADAKSATATNFTGLYARVALVLDNNGVSGLYVTQASINADGTVVMPSFMVPGLTVKGINIALVPTLADISSPLPNVKASDFRML